MDLKEELLVRATLNKPQLTLETMMTLVPVVLTHLLVHATPTLPSATEELPGTTLEPLCNLSPKRWRPPLSKVEKPRRSDGFSVVADLVLRETESEM